MRLGWVDGRRDQWIDLVKHAPTAARLHDLVLCLEMCTSVDWMRRTWRPFRTALTAAGRATSEAWKAEQKRKLQEQRDRDREDKAKAKAERLSADPSAAADGSPPAVTSAPPAAAEPREAPRNSRAESGDKKPAVAEPTRQEAEPKQMAAGSKSSSKGSSRGGGCSRCRYAANGCNKCRPDFVVANKKPGTAVQPLTSFDDLMNRIETRLAADGNADSKADGKKGAKTSPGVAPAAKSSGAAPVAAKASSATGGTSTGKVCAPLRCTRALHACVSVTLRVHARLRWAGGRVCASVRARTCEGWRDRVGVGR